MARRFKEPERDQLYLLPPSVCFACSPTRNVCALDYPLVSEPLVDQLTRRSSSVTCVHTPEKCTLPFRFARERHRDILGLGESDARWLVEQLLGAEQEPVVRCTVGQQKALVARATSEAWEMFDAAELAALGERLR